MDEVWRVSRWGLEEEVVWELWAQEQEQRKQSEGGRDEAGEGAETGLALRGSG